MSDAMLIWAVAALVIGGVLVVTAKFHKYTYDQLEPRRARQLYWGSWLIGGTLISVAMVPHGWQVVLLVGVGSVFAAVRYAGDRSPWLY